MENEKLNEMLAGIWDSLTDEQKEKAKACKTTDELIKLAGEEGIELPDEVLDAVAGGYIHLGTYWEAINDETGKVIGQYNLKSAAERNAKERGFSTEEITTDRVNQLRAAEEARMKKSGC